ncbi:MAG: beta strand repeat-containing protein, partial [Bdellovibrio sp.]
MKQDVERTQVFASWLGPGLILLIMLFSLAGEASPKSLSYQGRILKSDGTPLEHNNVSFLFEITNPNGSCVIYREQKNGVNMVNSKGVFDVPMGTGTKLFPLDPTKSILSVFDNSATLDCGDASNQVSGSYTPVAGHTRILRVQFHDGVGWNVISSDIEIRSVPFAAYAQSAQTLGSKTADDFMAKDTFDSYVASAACTASQSMYWNSATDKFECRAINVGLVGDVTGSIGASKVVALQNFPVGSGSPNTNQVLMWNGSQWTPSNLPAQSGGTVTSVTKAGTAGNPIIIAGTATDPTVGIAVATSSANGYLTSADWTLFNGKQAGSSELSGLSGIATTGIIQRTAAGSYTALGTTDPINVTAGNIGLALGAGLKVTAGALVPDFGTTAGTVVQGNDSRLSGNLQAAGGTMTGMLTLATGTTTLSPLRIPAGTLTTAMVSGNVESDGSNIYWTNSSASRNKLATYTGTPANGQILIGDGSGFSLANITSGAGVTITNSAGGITIAATGTGGTVTGVSSANSDIGVSVASPNPALTLNSGTAGGAGDANKIAKLDGSGLLAVNMIPNISAAKITSGTLPITNGGTGATSAAAARTNLGLGTSAVLDTGALSGNIPLVGLTGLTSGKMCTADGTGGIVCTADIPIGDFKANGSVPMSGVLRTVAGTAAAPGITFSGDTANGIYSPGANIFAVSTSGAERMRVESNGAVAIGASTTSAKLTVAGSVISTTNTIATGGAVDLSLSNIHYLASVGGSTIALNNMVNGGVYTIVVADLTPRTYTFSGCSASYFSPANEDTDSSGQTIYG